MSELKRFLPCGKQNAASVAKLADALGTTERNVRALAAVERANGVPIISPPTGGYYLAPPTEEGIRELIRFTARLRAVGTRTLKTAAALERCITSMNGQLSLLEDERERET